MKQQHILKTDKDVFQASWDGMKTYEIRFDDRNFQPKDELLLVETHYTGEEMKNGNPLIYTGRSIQQLVTHKLKNMYGLCPGWCILSIFQFSTNSDYKSIT